MKKNRTNKYFFVIFGLFIGSILIFLNACKQGFLYHQQRPDTAYHLELHKGVELKQSKIDMLWVIDNSSSMEHFQNEVKENIRIFIENLSNENFQANWKMGLISTSAYERHNGRGFSVRPYLGFETPFDSSHPNPEFAFRRAVTDMSTGDGAEKTFFPVLNILEKYPSFLRDDAILVLFILTDEEESSKGVFEVSPEKFLKQLYLLKGHKEKVFIHGAFASSDFCPELDEPYRYFYYQGSRYQKVIEETGGLAFSACTDTFGERFTEIAENIKENSFTSYISLNKRPVINTVDITVGTNAISLKGGHQEQEPYWLYNDEDNAIEFYHFQKIKDQMDSIRIHYQIDDGYDR